MDRMVYVAMNGAKQIMHRQAINNNNLANLNTTGFRTDLETTVPVDLGTNAPTTRKFAANQSVGVSTRTGDIFTTGRALDVAVSENGYIAIQDENAEEAYSRRGDLTIGPGGMLENAAGYQVLGDGGPIAVPPYEEISISSDGTVSIKAPGQAAILQLDRIKLVSIDKSTITKEKNGLLKSSVAPEADASVTLQSGALESSNVNSVSALVKMISLARQYEIQIKLMKSAEDNESAATKILSLR